MPIDGIHSYPSIYALGHAAVADLLKAPVLVEEKVDGSQISFCLRESHPDFAELLGVRSKGAPIRVDAPNSMFANGVASIVARRDLLHVGWTYRGEYLAKPKHNALAYDRTPKDHIILFDINPGLEQYLSREEMLAEAARIGFEVVPLIHDGMVEDIAQFRTFLEAKSCLGGPLVEGVVVKPKARDAFGRDKKLLMAKFVSEAFKEVHAAEWKESNPGQGDILATLAREYRTPARWIKAVGHLRDAGKLENSPKDIGALIGEIPADIAKECREEIVGKIWAWVWPHLSREVTKGMAEWYKEELLKRQFEDKL